ncbi:MAG: YraN family protein [bacterium]|nr:YraN family protein [bacterium]
MLFWKEKKRKSMGASGEDIVAKFLKDKGYKIIERNFKNYKGRQLGEIDIIAEKNKEIIFVEVKTRELEKYQTTLPEENITFSKLHKLSKIANSYIKTKNLWNFPYHFDAVSVWLSQDYKTAKIKHIENIFI